MAMSRTPAQANVDDEAAQAARSSCLRHVTDQEPEYNRRRAGTGFSYRDVDGETIREAVEREPIEALAILPAWEDVWICPSEDGHVRAGR